MKKNWTFPPAPSARPLNLFKSSDPSIAPGTTWHAAGLVGRIGGSPRVTAMRKYGAELYAALEETTGMSSGYVRNGGVTVATDKFRLDLIREWISRANAQGVEAYEIGPGETKERAPLLNTTDVIASLWSPGDGTALSGSISTVLTVLSWICAGIHSRRALPCPVCA